MAHSNRRRWFQFLHLVLNHFFSRLVHILGTCPSFCSCWGIPLAGSCSRKLTSRRRATSLWRNTKECYRTSRLPGGFPTTNWVWRPAALRTSSIRYTTLNKYPGGSCWTGFRKGVALVQFVPKSLNLCSKSQTSISALQFNKP